MSHPESERPDLTPLRAAASQAELAKAFRSSQVSAEVVARRAGFLWPGRTRGGVSGPLADELAPALDRVRGGLPHFSRTPRRLRHESGILNRSGPAGVELAVPRVRTVGTWIGRAFRRSLCSPVTLEGAAYECASWTALDSVGDLCG